ncbi:MAG: peptidyl-prolyl cis-trans isomerase [Cyclobacteriaceae bacterium]
MRFYFLLILFLSFGCEFFKPKESREEPPVARVGENQLYRSDLDGLFQQNTSSEDSTKLTEKYIDDWVKKQLMISSSSKSIDVNEAEIERKVLDYRYALIVHSFIKKYIDQNLNYDVSKEEIKKYYDGKSDNFLLKQNLIKCIYVEIPKTSPNLRAFRRNFKSFPDKNQDEVESYISQFASKSFLEDSVWVIFDEVILGTPLEGVKDKKQFLQKNKYSETSNDESTYFLKVSEFKTADEISPLEFIKEDIKSIIINKRKITLKKKLEEKIYEEAKLQDLFEVYRN